MVSTPDELVGTDDAPWRVWVRDRGLHPVEVLLEVQRLHAVRVPSRPNRAPARQRHIDEHIDELRELVIEAVGNLERGGVRLSA